VNVKEIEIRKGQHWENKVIGREISSRDRRKEYRERRTVFT